MKNDKIILLHNNCPWCSLFLSTFLFHQQSHTSIFCLNLYHSDIQFLLSNKKHIFFTYSEHLISFRLRRRISVIFMKIIDRN